MTNVVFWTMEMKFIMCKNLIMCIGEVGPVEVELLFTAMLTAGGIFGTDGL